MHIKCLRITYLEHEKYEKAVQNIKLVIKAHTILRSLYSSYLYVHGGVEREVHAYIIALNHYISQKIYSSEHKYHQEETQKKKTTKRLFKRASTTAW